MSYKVRSYLLRMHQIDTRMCVAVNHTSEYRIVRHFFRAISRLGDGVFWYSLMVLLVLSQGLSAIYPVLHMVIAGLTGTLLYKWLKGKTLRPRPYEVRQDIRLTGSPLDKFSFPSGHTLHAVVFSFVALSYYSFLMPVVLPFAILVGMSRVVLGLHYPSDVFAGAIIGLLIGYLSFGFVSIL
jgi:undecaprenyl-diphosphatase